MCLCCEAAPSSFLHTVVDCAVWGMLWRWAQMMNAWVGKPLPATTRRPEWFAFGAGIRDTNHCHRSWRAALLLDNAAAAVEEQPHPAPQFTCSHPALPLICQSNPQSFSLDPSAGVF